jgi:hypothetical protein
MNKEDFDVLSGILMVISQVAAIVAAGYGIDKLRHHFSWIRRIAP